MGVQRAEREGEIEASREACWTVLLDLESYPDWQPAVRSAVVEERDAEGRASRVEFTADAVVRKIRYVVRYHYDEPAHMWWDMVEGDLKAGDGEFVLEALGPDRTHAIYRLTTDLGFYVPAPLLKKGTEKLMSGVVKGLASRAEARAGA